MCLCYRPPPTRQFGPPLTPLPHPKAPSQFALPPADIHHSPPPKKKNNLSASVFPPNVSCILSHLLILGELGTPPLYRGVGVTLAPPWLHPGSTLAPPLGPVPGSILSPLFRLNTVCKQLRTVPSHSLLHVCLAFKNICFLRPVVYKSSLDDLDRLFPFVADVTFAERYRIHPSTRRTPIFTLIFWSQVFFTKK